MFSSAAFKARIDQTHFFLQVTARKVSAILFFSFQSSARIYVRDIKAATLSRYVHFFVSITPMYYDLVLSCSFEVKDTITLAIF